LYVILRGRVRVERTGTKVGELRAGDFFGELALIEDEPRSASVIAVEETECLLFLAWEFRSLLDEHPQIAAPIMRALIERLHRQEHHGS
ncbi:MAG: cyclic nucleotide-binding domain-containing protein, partial [Chloroflexi bacterium]|nr:cyclic nucleotide-binding domain-containing protein [Chloroflexota bacterium]